MPLSPLLICLEGSVSSCRAIESSLISIVPLFLLCITWHCPRCSLWRVLEYVNPLLTNEQLDIDVWRVRPKVIVLLSLPCHAEPWVTWLILFRPMLAKSQYVCSSIQYMTVACILFIIEQGKIATPPNGLRHCHATFLNAILRHTLSSYPSPVDHFSVSARDTKKAWCVWVVIRWISLISTYPEFSRN